MSASNMNNALEKMVALLAEADLVCAAVDKATASMQNIIEESKEKKYRRMMDDLMDLKDIFAKTKAKEAWILTPLSTCYRNDRAVIKLIPNQCGFQLWSCDPRLPNSAGLYLTRVDNRFSYKKYAEWDGRPSCVSLVTDMMERWDSIWPEVQNSFVEFIRSHIDEKISTSAKSYERTKQMLEDECKERAAE